MAEFSELISVINSHLSDYVLVILLTGIGIFFSFKTRFVQIRCFKEAWSNTFRKKKQNCSSNAAGLSSYQALATAIAAQVGTGNIVGASGAILIGGPGAIFWMWLIAFFGMATIYAEAVLAQKTRIIDADRNIHGGPVYYIRWAFPNKFGKILAGFFAVATVFSLGFMGSMVQANSIGESSSNAFGIPPWSMGIAVALLAGFIFIGGISRIAKAAENIVPLMAMLYIIGGVAVLALRAKYIPETFGCIFKYAFMPEALLGGGFGHALKTAVSQGVKRGLFSNEAGMGSTPHAHAAAEVKTPHVQGTVAMLGVFLDTAVVLTVTALIIISVIYTGDGPLANATGETYHELIADAGLTKTNLVQHAVAAVTCNATGNFFVAACLFFFSFTTILSWNYFGRINFHYLFGKKAAIIYSVISLISIFLGTVVKNDLVWELQDMFNQLMVLPNVIALAALSRMAAESARRQ